jgi:four helix bundle protein
MKYARFEDLPVWKAAVELAERVYGCTRRRFFSQPGDLRDQLRRAALSVSNNIAEGFERGSTAELLAYLYIARGSAGEVRSMLRFTLGLLDSAAAARGSPESEISNLTSEISHLQPEISTPKSEISDLKSEISDLIHLAESCSRQIRAWADSLQNTEIKGQRHLTEKTRREYDSVKRAATFQREVQERLRQAHPELFPGAPDET